MSKVEVTIQAQGGAEVARTTTDEQGRFTLKGISSGTYVLLAQKNGFKPATKVIVSAQRKSGSFDLALESEQALTVAVKTTQLRAQNGLTSTGTSKYTLTSRDITNLPEGAATPLNKVVLQMPGIALDQNQEIHIREFEVPRIRKNENRMILENISDRTNLIRPATGIGVFPSAYGPRITVYDSLTIPLPSLKQWPLYMVLSTPLMCDRFWLPAQVRPRHHRSDT
jgi:hypothetical protein